MAIQFRVDSVEVDGGIVRFQIGPYGLEREKAWFFDRSSFNDTHMVKNLRLARNIGTQAELASREFLDAVNGVNKGMDLGDGTYFIRNIALVAGTNDEYEVGFAKTRNGAVTQTITVNKNALTQPTSENPEDVLDNVKAFLRVGGFTDFTPAAINAIKARRFWA